MSHFFTVVMVPGTTLPEHIEETVEGLLAPYDENLRVDSYKAYLDHEDLEHMASYYHTSPHDLATLVHSMEDWAGSEGGVDEQGLYRWSTYNPQSKWDWWVISGRWNGAIRDAQCSDASGCNADDQYRQLNENMLPAKHLDHKLTCFALVTPDGTWHERGKMGWWAVVADEQDEDSWNEEIVKLIQQHQDCILVGVDCHI